MFETISRQINDETHIPSGNIVEILLTVDKALYDRQVVLLLEFIKKTLYIVQVLSIINAIT